MTCKCLKPGPMATVAKCETRNAKCTMPGEGLQIAGGKELNNLNAERRKEKKKGLTGASESTNQRRASRRTRCLGMSNNAHDPPRLPLGKDQLPLCEDLGQPLLPFVVVVYNRFDELVNVYRSPLTSFLVPDLDIKLNPGVNPRSSRILSR